MGRKQDTQRLDEILKFIQANEPQKPGTIAQQIGIDNKTMMRALVLLNDRGDLLAEDDQEYISLFDPKQP